MCVLVLYRATAGRLEARHFRHTTFSRLCMLLLSSYNFLGVTVNADSNTPQSESGKRAASWRPVSRIVTLPRHNPPLTEWTVLSKNRLSVRHTILCDYSGHACVHTPLQLHAQQAHCLSRGGKCLYREARLCQQANNVFTVCVWMLWTS